MALLYQDWLQEYLLDGFDLLFKQFSVDLQDGCSVNVLFNSIDKLFTSCLSGPSYPSKALSHPCLQAELATP